MYPYSEIPARVTAIREALLVDSRFRFAEPELITPYHIEEDPRLLAVHNHEYLQFLDTIYSDWTLANRPKTGVIPDTFAVRVNVCGLWLWALNSRLWSSTTPAALFALKE